MISGMRFSIIIVALSAASPFVHAPTDGVGGSNSCQADGQLIQLLRRHVDEAASLCGIPRRKVITKTVTSTTTTTKVVRKVIHTTTTVDQGRKLKAREVQAEATGTVEVLRPRVDLDSPVEMALSDALGDFAAAAVLSACECLNQVEVITTTTTVLKTSVVKTTTTTTSITVETNGAFRIFATEDGDRRKRSNSHDKTQFHESVEDAIQFRLIHGVDDPKVLWFTSEGLGNLYGIYWSEFEYGDFFPQAVQWLTPAEYENFKPNGYKYLRWQINSGNNKLSLTVSTRRTSLGHRSGVPGGGRDEGPAVRGLAYANANAGGAAGGDGCSDNIDPPTVPPAIMALILVPMVQSMMQQLPTKRTKLAINDNENDNDQYKK
ncbi:hypothetical protein V8F06_003761 [Rhypophila decipiens]